MDYKKYESSYSESSFWDKIEKFSKKLGKAPLKSALILYYAMTMGKATPAQIALIIGALGYLISPIDAVPDMLPGGLVDDGGVLAATVTALSCCSDPMVVAAAENKLKEWFD